MCEVGFVPVDGFQSHFFRFVTFQLLFVFTQLIQTAFFSRFLSLVARNFRFFIFLFISRVNRETLFIVHLKQAERKKNRINLTESYGNIINDFHVYHSHLPCGTARAIEAKRVICFFRVFVELPDIKL